MRLLLVVALAAVVGAVSLEVLHEDEKTGSCKGKVEVFQHANFKGRKGSYKVGSCDFKCFMNAFGGGRTYNDQASSIKVPKGCKAVVYQHGDFKGWAATFAAGNHDMGDFIKAGAKNDDASAIKVYNSAATKDFYCSLKGDPHIRAFSKKRYNHYGMGPFTAYKRGNVKITTIQGRSKTWKHRAVIHAFLINVGGKKYSLQINSKSQRCSTFGNLSHKKYEKNKILRFGGLTVRWSLSCRRRAGDRHLNLYIYYVGTSLKGISGTCANNRHKRPITYANVVALAKKKCHKDYKNTLKIVAHKCRKCITQRRSKHCATEHAKNDWCKCNGVVAYGAKGRFYRKNVKGKIRCNNASFRDPIRGTKKTCKCEQKTKKCDNGKKYIGCQMDQIRSVCAARKGHLSKAAAAKKLAAKYKASSKNHAAKASKYGAQAKKQGAAAARFSKSAKKLAAKAKENAAKAGKAAKAKAEHLAAKARHLKAAAAHAKASAAFSKKAAKHHKKRAGHLAQAAKHAKKAIKHLKTFHRRKRRQRKNAGKSRKASRTAQYHKKQADKAFKRFKKSLARARHHAQLSKTYKAMHRNCRVWKRLSHRHAQVAAGHYRAAKRHLSHLKKSRKYHKIYTAKAARYAQAAAKWSRLAGKSLKRHKKHKNKAAAHKVAAKAHLKAARKNAAAARLHKKAHHKAKKAARNSGKAASKQHKKMKKHKNLAHFYNKIAKTHAKLAAKLFGHSKNNKGKSFRHNIISKSHAAASGKHSKTAAKHAAAAKALGL